MMLQRLSVVVALALALPGCSTVREVLGLPNPGDPSVAIRSAETRWVLIKNPRFGDVASEPEYIWVEEDKIPFTIKGVFNRNAILAPPEIVAKYGSPPGGGKISPRQGVPSQTSAAEPPRATAPSPAGAASPRDIATAALVPPKRGIVVYLDTTRIVVDLTAADGVRPGTLLSLRRDKIPIVHPVTGEVLGELDEEVATARVTETRERFSVADVQTVAPGAQIQIKDRVVFK